jgi:methionyl-tRNA formyltransferase
MTEPLRAGFAGTSEFACVALEALLARGFEVPLVLCQPDRPSGRGMKLQAPPVKQLATQRGLPLLQPRSLRLDGRYPQDAHAAQQALEAARLDALVVAAYGLLLPPWLLSMPPLGCLNIHASLLPRWRGAAPIHRAIEAGDGETGITIMRLDEGLDTGAMLLAGREPIRPDDTTGRLHDRLAALGARLIVLALDDAAAGRAVLRPQPAEGATYAAKIDKTEARIDWQAAAATIERRVRAFDPAPGAVFELEGASVKLWRAEVVPAAGRAGTVLSVDTDRFVVACGDGALALTEIQPAGARRMAVRDFLAGRPLAVGTRLG